MENTTALLVIDPQRVYTDPESELYCADSGSTLDRMNSLIELAVRRNWLVVPVRHIHRADGSDLGRMFDYAGDDSGDFNFRADSDEVNYDDRLTLPPGTEEIIKNRYSAFAGTRLDEILKTRGISRIVVIGFMTNFCCESTAREAHDRDYFVDFITDATGTPGTENIDEEQMRTFVEECLAAGIATTYSTDAFLGLHR